MSWFFALGLFVSAALLFLIQPMVGKLLLPKFGGTPFVWVTCMLFFQAAGPMTIQTSLTPSGGRSLSWPPWRNDPVMAAGATGQGHGAADKRWTTTPASHNLSLVSCFGSLCIQDVQGELDGYQGREIHHEVGDVPGPR